MGPMSNHPPSPPKTRILWGRVVLVVGLTLVAIVAIVGSFLR